MPWLLIPVVILLPFVVVILIMRTAAFQPREVPVSAMRVSVAKSAVAKRLARLLTFPTVSRLDESTTDWPVFDAFIAQIAKQYPRVHEELTLERIAGYGLLYRWKGRVVGRPSVLMAHYDVVPAEDGEWPHPPFAGVITDGVIWGRGAIDDKQCVAGILEAVEAQLAKGTQPANDIYLAFGSNEETTGTVAAQIVAHLRRKKVDFNFVLDEGGAVVSGAFPGVSRPMAVVGIGEKGVLDLKLTVRDPGGHASTPDKYNATMRLSRAITRLGNDPFPARLTKPVRQMIERVGVYTPTRLRVIFANLWLFGGLLPQIFTRTGSETAAMTRTTVVATQLSGSKAANVLAAEASAVLNIRILPGETVTTVVERVRRVIADDGIELAVIKGEDPSPISRTDNEPWRILERTILETYDDAIPTPYLMLGASDSRHYAAYSDAVYRFSPFAMSKEMRATLHAAGEHIPVEAYAQGVAFYQRLILALSTQP